MKISRRLEIKYPDYESGHLYSLQEVQEATYHVLRASSSSLSVPQLLSASNPALVPSNPALRVVPSNLAPATSNLVPEASSIVPEIPRLQEAMSGMLGELQSILKRNWA
ncbi:hypothetical protein PHLCEN_2v4227, partial [Hermanssonia centrifuga]